MKRTRAQQPKAQEAQDPASPKPQRRGKQARQPKAGGAKKPAAAAREAAAAAASAANAVPAAAASPGAETAPTVPDVCAGEGERGAGAVEWDLDGGASNGSWWTWGVDEDKLLGWFPFVEEDFGCAAGVHAEAAFDDDIWRIHQIYEIPNYAAK